MDSISENSLHHRLRRHQPAAAAGDRLGGGLRRVVQLESRDARQPVLRLLLHADRRCVRRVPVARPVSAVCVLRDRGGAKIFPDRHLGRRTASVRGDEAGALFLRRQRAGVAGNAGSFLFGAGRHQRQGVGDIQPVGLAARWRGTARGSAMDFPADFLRLRHNGRHVAVPHLGTDRPRGSADGGKHAAGGRGDETGRVRLPARGRRAAALGSRGLGTLGGGRRNHQHRLWRARCPETGRLQVRHRLLECQPHGLCAAGHRHAEPHRHDRRRAADVLPRCDRCAALRIGRHGDLFAHQNAHAR